MTCKLIYTVGCMPPNDLTDPSEESLISELVMEKSADLFCDNCGHFPIEPVHGHFVCPSCHMPTKCCEGAPLDE